MAVTIETNSRAEIRRALAAKFGSVSEFCLRNRIPYTTLTNMLGGRVSASKHARIVGIVEREVGADLSAWSR